MYSKQEHLIQTSLHSIIVQSCLPQETSVLVHLV